MNRTLDGLLNRRGILLLSERFLCADADRGVAARGFLSMDKRFFRLNFRLFGLLFTFVCLELRRAAFRRRFIRLWIFFTLIDRFFDRHNLKLRRVGDRLDADLQLFKNRAEDRFGSGAVADLLLDDAAKRLVKRVIQPVEGFFLTLFRFQYHRKLVLAH